MTHQDYFFTGPLSEIDPAVAGLIDIEAERQMRKLIMIASESLCPEAVRHALSSEFVNIYAEGYPSTRMSRWECDSLDDHARHLAFFRRYADRRYYKGTEYTDFVESLAQRRCAKVFATDDVPADEIFVNVQPLSGAAANNAAYEALVPHGGVVMGMALPHGGHLTHGSELNRSGKTYKIIPYEVNPATGRLDYSLIKAMAEEHDPAMIIAGASAYPWALDWKKLREAANAAPSGAFLYADIAHTAGLVAGGAYPSPVGFADLVAFTTHKTLCGPRGAVLLTTDPEIAKLMDNAVFPGEQGGPHLHTIAAKAVAFALAATPSFGELQTRTVENAKALAEGFASRDIPLAYGGTDSHLLLVDLNRLKTRTGSPLRADAVSRVLDICGLVLNKNTIAGDEKALQPSGLRFGTTVVTQRGMGPAEMDTIADIVAELLHGMGTFEIIGLGGPVGRVRVSLDLLEKTTRRLSELADRSASAKVVSSGGYPHFGPGPAACRDVSGMDPSGEEAALAALSKGSALFDNGDSGHILVRGERAQAMLHGLCTADIQSLKPYETVDTLVLRPDGTVWQSLLLSRFGDSPHGHPTFLIQTGPDACRSVLSTLRALSDGYVDLGREDLYLKIEGPAVVEDLQERRGKKWTSLTLAGPEAFSTLVSAFSGLDDAPAWVLTQARLDEGEIWAVSDRGSFVHVWLEADGLPALRTRLCEAKAVAGGPSVRSAWAASRGLPAGGSKPEAYAGEAAGGERPLAAMTKPFFVGQSALLEVLPAPEALPAFSWEPGQEKLRRTPLYEAHVDAGATMVPFAGWEMPVVYTTIGEEHEAVRDGAGFFDVAHMGVFEASGPHACRFLEIVTTNYVGRLRVGESQYSYLLEPTGEVIDDLMIYMVAPETYMVVVNASNAEKDWAWMSGVNEGKFAIDPANPRARVEQPCRFRNLKDPSSGPDMRIDLAVQGPLSMSVLCDASDSQTAHGISILPKSNNLHGRMAGVDVIVSRTGYTGEEYGYELYVHPDKAVQLWRAIVEAGEVYGLTLTGLGARDSTRTEAGLPLYGHELAGDYGIDPLEAGYGQFVKWHKPFFVGRQALLDRSKNPLRSLIRFSARGSGVRLAKTGDPLINRKERVIGHVTSCAKVGDRQIGLAIVDVRQARPGASVGFFSLPRKGKSKPESPRDQLVMGDSVTTPVDGEIIDRFPQ